MNIGENIKRMRLDLCLSQKEFADQIQVTASSVSHYEGNTRKPTYATVRKIIALAKKNKLTFNQRDFIEGEEA